LPENAKFGDGEFLGEILLSWCNVANSALKSRSYNIKITVTKF